MLARQIIAFSRAKPGTQKMPKKKTYKKKDTKKKTQKNPEKKDTNNPNYTTSAFSGYKRGLFFKKRNHGVH